MLIVGLDFFEFDCFKTQINTSNFTKLQMKNGVFDELFLDEDILTYSNTKEQWHYKTVIIPKFINNLEAGTAETGGIPIKYIKFQKRKVDELTWLDVGLLPYDFLERLYLFTDKYIQNGYEYEYCALPLTATVTGNRLTSETIKADFDGNYLTDKTNNYKFMYNTELGDIEHIQNYSLQETLNAKYPITTFSNNDYRKGVIKCLFLSNSTIENYGTVDVRQEKNNRSNLMSFLKNRKPKLFRTSSGEYMIVLSLNPRETPNNSVIGISEVSVDFVEIDEINNDTLVLNGLV
jgi:hypothetical protein